jgi:hypothetical protein
MEQTSFHLEEKMLQNISSAFEMLELSFASESVSIRASSLRDSLNIFSPPSFSYLQVPLYSVFCFPRFPSIAFLLSPHRIPDNSEWGQRQSVLTH